MFWTINYTCACVCVRDCAMSLPMWWSWIAPCVRVAIFSCLISVVIAHFSELVIEGTVWSRIDYSSTYWYCLTPKSLFYSSHERCRARYTLLTYFFSCPLRVCYLFSLVVVFACKFCCFWLFCCYYPLFWLCLISHSAIVYMSKVTLCLIMT